MADPQVWLESSPVVTVRLTIEQQTEKQINMRQLFGTDGMRGVAGSYPLDPPTTFALGVALGRWVVKHPMNHANPEVVIGMDTRESGPWIAAHVAGGLQREGVSARFAGLITTPGVAYVARTGAFAAGRDDFRVAQSVSR